LTPNESFGLFLATLIGLADIAVLLLIRQYLRWIEKRAFLRSEGLPMSMMKYRDEE